jgi:hypothetical protein
MSIFLENSLLEQMSQEICIQIDKDILTDMQAIIIVEQEAKERSLREEYPTLMEAWEEYQVKLKLIQAGQLTR